MDLAAAAALLESQLALENSVAARVALAKYQVPCTPELALALEKVGSYTANEVPFTVPHFASSSLYTMTLSNLNSLIATCSSIFIC